MGPQEDYIETVVTCEGDFDDPQLQERLQRFQQRLERLLLQDGQNQLILKKVEPWNSVRVTFNIPRDAALRLKQLAEQGNAALRQLGVLGVQIEGDRLVSLTVQTHNNQRAELVFNTSDGPAGHAEAAGAIAPSVGAAISFEGSLPSSSEDLASGQNIDVTRKNIEEYLRQFNSILPQAVGAGSSGAGPSCDVFKMPSQQNTFRPNNIAADGLAGPSGIGGHSLKSDSRMHGPGAFASPVPAPTVRGPRGSSNHQRQQQKQQQQQQQQQFSSQPTALPQTAAVGLMDLPPPPPYPHVVHRSGVANNVGRQGKKSSAASPLLINLLQTEPVAGGNLVTNADEEKPKKKRRKRKEKQTGPATSTEEKTSLGVGTCPMDASAAINNISQPCASSADEMSVVLHRRVSPIPLPSSRMTLSTGVQSLPEVVSGNESQRDRPKSAANTNLVSLAQGHRTAADPETIINPYTGQLEPRDSASDLSPVKKDQHKTRPDSHPAEMARKDLTMPPVSASVSTSAAYSESSVNEIVDSSFRPAALKEDISRGYPSVAATVVTSSGHLQTTNASYLQCPGLAVHGKASFSPSTAMSISTQHYAPHYGPSQIIPHASYPSPQQPTYPSLPTVNGPVSATQQTLLPYPVPTSQDSRVHLSEQAADSTSTDCRVHVPRVEVDAVSAYHTASQRQPASVRADLAHALAAGDVVRQQSVTAASMLSQAPAVVDTRQGVVVSSQQSAPVSHNKLLNCTLPPSSSHSPAPAGGVQRLLAESVSSANATASPSGSKPSSDGDDNSNHSGTSPVCPADSTMATSSLLDANGTKADNHDSGVGSSSERSEDTTPSEAGDGEFQTHVTTEASDSSRSAMGVTKAIVNCRKEGSGGADSHNLTVGYVHVNQQTTELYHKDHLADPSVGVKVTGDKGLSNESVRQVTSHLKSLAGVSPPVSQLSLVSQKQMELSVSLPSKVNSQQLIPQASLPQQHQNPQLLMKHKSLTPASGIYQNGPLSVMSGLSQQLPATLRLPITCQSSAMHHQGAITNIHTQGGRLPLRNQPVSTPVGIPAHHPAGVQGVHPPAGVRSHLMHHPGAGNHGQHLHPLPSSIPSSRGADSFAPASLPGQGMSGLHTALHMSASASVQSFQHSFSSGAGRPALDGQAGGGPRTAGMLSYPNHPMSSPAHVGQGNGLPPSQGGPGLQHTAVPQSPGQHPRTPSPSSHPSQRPPSHGPAMTYGSSGGHGLAAQGQAVEHTMSRGIISSMAPQVKPSVDLAASNALATAHGLAPVSKSGHNSFYGVNLTSVFPSSPVSSDQEGGLPASVTRQGSPRQAAPNPHSLPISLSKSPIAHDLDSMASSLEFLEASFHPGEGLFSPDDDLALLSDSGFFTDHASTNGSGGLNTETRAGSNITSMYTKRSSPINVNMLNHMYAAGLPQPRRLTESVQRLVKPLPNPENALPPGARTCKSPGSSGSRHSSNGSASPGRATQGGTRSPGASLSPSPGSRAERLASSPSAYPMMAGGYSTAYHNAQSSVLSEPAANCMGTSGISVLLPPLSPMQPVINRQKGSSGPHCFTGQSGLSSASSSSVISSVLQPASACLSSVASLPSSLMLTDGATSVVMSHMPLLSQDGMPAHVHSADAAAAAATCKVVSPLSDPSTTSSHSSPPLPALVSLSQDSGGEVSKDPGFSSVRVSVQSGTATSPQHTHAIPLHMHHPSVSVCNTSSVVDTAKSVAEAASSSSPSPPFTFQSITIHGSSTLCSASKPCLPVVTHSVHPQSDLSTQASTDSPHCASAETRNVETSDSMAASFGSCVERGLTVSQCSSQCQQLTARPEVTQDCAKVDFPVSSSAGADSAGLLGEAQMTHCGYSYSHIAGSAHPETKVTCVPVSEVDTVFSHSESCVRPSPAAGGDNSKPSVEEDLSVPKLESALEIGPPALVLKDKEGGRACGLAPLSMPALSAQDLTQQRTCHGESPYSKPPLLHPTPPFIPTVVPSATPPPPPLTPVLPNDTGRKDSQGHNTPPHTGDGHGYMTSVFGLRDAARTTSPLASEPLVADSSENGDTKDVSLEKLTGDSASKEGAFVEANGSKLDTVDPQLADCSCDEGSLKSRRLTRKRKPTLSESDSSSNEPAPKITCLELAPNTSLNKIAENSKGGSSPDHPPKLQREGKRSGDKKEEERVGKNEEGLKCEEGKAWRVKEESGRVKEEGKGIREEEKGKEESKGGRDEDRDGSRQVEKSTKHTKDSRVLEATPEEVAQKIAASGGKRRFYTYVPENKLNDSFFDVKLLPARTRNQGKAKDGVAGPSVLATSTGTPGALAGAGAGQQTGSSREKEEGGEGSTHGSKRATRQRNRDPSEGGQSKRKRAKEHR